MLSNDEIDRQVALLEGWTIDASDVSMPLWIDPEGFADTRSPRFTTEWAYCGPLLQKMQASVFFGASFTNITVHHALGRSEVTVCDDDPKRAICLAFIESAGGNRVEK